MPLYEYQCDACGQRFEMIQKFSDPSPDACRKCGKGPVHRLMSSPAIQFKGTGWYITDYAKGNSGAPASSSTKSDGETKSGDSGSSDSSKSDSGKSDSGKSDGGKSESKSESSKSETKSDAAPAPAKPSGS